MLGGRKAQNTQQVKHEWEGEMPFVSSVANGEGGVLRKERTRKARWRKN